MEGLLILIAIVVIDAVIKGAAKKRKQQQQLPRQNQPQQDQSHSGNYEDEETGRSQAPRSLQDLIRQFQEAQREASQGTYVPPDPSVEEDDGDLPVVRPANPGHFSFIEIAESVIQWEEVSVSYLQEAFGFSKATAAKVLAELQNHKIVGRDMGDGFCDILVHDKVELSNLFKREQAEAKKQMKEDLARKKAELQSKWKHEAEAPNATVATNAVSPTAADDATNDITDELERQRQLNELESRAREAREHAGTGLAEAAALASTAEGNESARRRAPLLSTKNIADIRRGFLWAKVIDEPRFKKRWSAQAR